MDEWSCKGPHPPPPQWWDLLLTRFRNHSTCFKFCNANKYPKPLLLECQIF
jgi:hypothetical protein